MTISNPHNALEISGVAANTNAPENPTCTEIATAAPDAATHPRKDACRDTLGTSRATRTALTIATSNSTPKGSATVNGIGRSLATEYAAHGRASRVGTAAMATRTDRKSVVSGTRRQ